jgi:hypothetical protein
LILLLLLPPLILLFVNISLMPQHTPSFHFIRHFCAHNIDDIFSRFFFFFFFFSSPFIVLLPSYSYILYSTLIHTLRHIFSDITIHTVIFSFSLPFPSSINYFFRLDILAAVVSSSNLS